MNQSSNSPKIAIVCDWLYGGGAEKVVLELHNMYPSAPIYTSYCSDEWRQRLDGKVQTGYLQWRPFAATRRFLPLLRQWWFRRLNLKSYDVVISCTGNGEAKFVRTGPHAKHICYCFTPPHFYWRKYDEYIRNPGMGRLDPIARLGLKLLVKPLRRRDYQAAQRVNEFISISTHIQADIKRYYGRDSSIIHPPVVMSHTKPKPRKKSMGVRAVYWGRHVPYKRIDLAIAACNELQIPFTIIGTGPETKRLKQIAGPTITFAGFVPDQKLPELAADASVFLFPGEEDFGIAPVEALALGLPIIAYDSGGARDYVVSGKTGELFADQTMASLRKALGAFRPQDYSISDLQAEANRFTPAKFHKAIHSHTSG